MRCSAARPHPTSKEQCTVRGVPDINSDGQTAVGAWSTGKPLVRATRPDSRTGRNTDAGRIAPPRPEAWNARRSEQLAWEPKGRAEQATEAPSLDTQNLNVEEAWRGRISRNGSAEEGHEAQQRR
ncbi:hypothetical protein ERJ75_000513100 [Trypanosoma vivax]|nr:hypothetical protein ERJ75_000513100 [Trypanosoma vivax]